MMTKAIESLEPQRSCAWLSFDRRYVGLHRDPNECAAHHRGRIGM